MTAETVCPFCLRKNKPGADSCVHCGVSLRPEGNHYRTTRQVLNKQSEKYLEQARVLDLPANLNVGDVALFVMDNPEPIIVSVGDEVTLGRFSEDSPSNLIDFSTFDGIEHGVSRQHCRLIVDKKGCRVVDLGSTNGTWLNEKRLESGRPFQMQHGDRFRLGYLKIVPCIYAGEGSRETLLFLATADSPQPLTPDLMATAVLPFLELVKKIQHVSDALHQRPQAELRVLTINQKAGDQPIIVHTSGTATAVRWLRKWFAPWMEKVGQASVLPSSDLEQELTRLSAEMVADAVPDLADDASQNYVAQLVPLLQSLTASPIFMQMEE